MKRTGWKACAHGLWAWSWIVTLPITLVVVVWLFAVVERYRSLGVRLDVQGGASIMLRPIMEYEWYLLRRRFQLAFHFGGPASELRSVELFLPTESEAELGLRLPQSGREYVEGELVYPDGEAHNVSLRYRGDMMHHWGLGKKSWRIKTKKKRLWKAVRKFNLIVPETRAVLEEHLGYRVARDLGLLAPMSEIVNVRINERNRGVYTLVGQIDELFLRSNRRMPGDIFVGDLLFDDAIPGIDNRLFELPGMWTKAAINNHYPDEHGAAMVRLCDVLDWAPGPEKDRALDDILDLEACARFAAYRSLVQTGHVDHFHNWKLYYDPWRNRLEPLVWDPNAWAEAWAPTDQDPAFEWPLFAKLDRVLVQDQRYRWAFHRALFEYFQTEHASETLAALDASGAQIVLAAKNDPALAISVLPNSSEKLSQAVDALRVRAADYFDTFRARHMETPAQVTRSEPWLLAPGTWEMEITVDGWRPVSSIRLEFSTPLPEQAHFVWSVGSKQVPAPFSVRDREVILRQPLLPGVAIEPTTTRHSFTHTSAPRPMTYTLRLEFPGRSAMDLEAVFSVDLAGVSQPILAQAGWQRAGAVEESTALFLEPAPAVQVWRGEKTLQGLTEIHGDLTLAAGTQLRMTEGASVIVHGRLQALGTADQPILIGPAGTEQAPWGTFSIRTPAADHSVLTHVRFSGGSGYKDDLREFSAMFSAHDADGLRIEHCYFEQGRIVDDMVHVVYGKDLLMADCSFEGALSDALDLDGCQGRIERCTFQQSGNDAIDLMMSEIEVLDSVLGQSGDKGVSVGEGSQLRFVRGRVERCGIGIQVKDGSLAWIRGTLFDSNAQALHAYKKNWQYGSGGDGLVQDCDFRGNESFAAADEDSSWGFSSSRLPVALEKSGRLGNYPSFRGDLPQGIRAKFESSSLLRSAVAE